MSIERIYNYFPYSIGQIIAKNIHEFGLHNVLTQLIDLHVHKTKFSLVNNEFNVWLTENDGELWLEKRLQIVLQHYANEGRIHLKQYIGNRVGQSIHLKDQLNNLLPECGRSWSIINDDFFEWWKGSDYAIPVLTHLTQQEWSDNYGTWVEYVDDHHIRVCLMFNIPLLSDFEEFVSLRTGEYMLQYPGFTPIYIIMSLADIENVNVNVNEDENEKNIS